MLISYRRSLYRSSNIPHQYNRRYYRDNESPDPKSGRISGKNENALMYMFKSWSSIIFYYYYVGKAKFRRKYHGPTSAIFRTRRQDPNRG